MNVNRWTLRVYFLIFHKRNYTHEFDSILLNRTVNLPQSFFQYAEYLWQILHNILLQIKHVKKSYIHQIQTSGSFTNFTGQVGKLDNQKSINIPSQWVSKYPNISRQHPIIWYKKA